MKSQPQADHATPLWVRFTALWCIALCLGVSLVQACHDHERFTRSPHRISVSTLTGDEGGPELCPFCTGLHFCPPRYAADLLLGRLARPAELKVSPIVVAAAPLPFPLSSRPPPVRNNLHA